MFRDLLAAIESELNATVKAIQAMPNSIITDEQYGIFDELLAKKQRLESLAFDYLHLSNKFKEIAGLNSVY